MKRLFFLLLLNIISNICFAQDTYSLMIHQKGNVKTLLSNVDSIIHDNNNICIFSNVKKTVYQADKIDSITIQAKNVAGKCFKISDEQLNGWDEGVFYADEQSKIDSFYVVSHANIEDGTKIIHLDKFGNSDISSSISIVFGQNLEIQDAFIYGYQFEAHSNDENVVFIIYDKDGKTVGCIEVPYDEINTEMLSTKIRKSNRAIAHYRIVNIRNFLNKAGGFLYNIIGISNNLDEGKYADILKDFLIGKLVGSYTKTFLSGLTQAQLIDLYLKQLYENNKNWFLGSANIEIISIKRTSKSSIKVEGEIHNVETIPTTRLVSYELPPYVQEIPNYALYGVAEGKSGQPGINLNENCTTPVVVSGSHFSCTLPIGYKPGQTYYFRPFLVPGSHYEGSADFGQMIGKTIATNARYGERKYYTDQKPNCTTGGADCITEKSAIVKCTFSGAEGFDCGAVISGDDKNTIFKASDTDGEKEIAISGLSPATTYNYWAFINVEGEPINGEVKSFTTNPPDISGVWNCTEEYYLAWDKNYEHPQYKTYSVSLNKDGTVTIDGKSDYARSAWSFTSDGKLLIAVMDMATTTFNSGFDISCTVDNVKEPHKFTGIYNNWSFNSTIGYISRGGNSVVLSR